jgi:hypothetical protein
LNGDDNAILSLKLNAIQNDIVVTEIEFELLGTATPTEISNLKLYNQEDGMISQRIPTAKSISFSLNEPITVPTGSTKELIVLADVKGTTGNTLGATLSSPRNIKVESGTVNLRNVPSTYDVGYIGVVPSTTVIDGGFSEWTNPNIDFELQQVENQNVDLRAFNITTDTSNVYFYLDVQGGIMSGALVPHWNLVTGETHYSVPMDTDKDRMPDEIDPTRTTSTMTLYWTRIRTSMWMKTVCSIIHMATTWFSTRL